MELQRVQKQREDDAQQLKTEMQTAVAAEKKLREDAVEKHKEELRQAEVRVTSATEALDALKAKCDNWLEKLVCINREMDS